MKNDIPERETNISEKIIYIVAKTDFILQSYYKAFQSLAARFPRLEFRE